MPEGRRSIRHYVAAGVALAVIVAGPFLSDRITSAGPEIATLKPPKLTRCRLLEGTESVPYWSNIAGADQRLKAVYLCDQIEVSLDVAHFASQHEGKEAVTSANRIVDTRLVSAALPERLHLDSGLEARAYRLDRGRSPATLWTWYAVDDQPLAGAVDAKMMEAWHALMLQRPDVSILTLAAWTADAVAADTILERAAPEVWAWYKSRGDS